MRISHGQIPRDPPARHLPRGWGRGRPPEAHHATLPDPLGTVISLDFPFRLLVHSVALGRILGAPPLRGSSPALSTTSGQVSGAAFHVGRLTRPPVGVRPVSRAAR